MTGIELLGCASERVTPDEDAFYATLEVARRRLARPFAEERLALVASVSEAILRGGPHSVSPFVTHFAFWTRKAALQRLRQTYLARLPPATQARPRGLVLHLPPRNVETVFLYSWVLSYLVGNANIVRLPSAISPEMRGICGLFLAALGSAESAGQFFVHYPSESDVSTHISALCDARVVWGGDAKVALFADVPLRQGGKSLWFGDRFSFSVIDGAAVMALDEAGEAALAERFFNDIFVFDQMACASPHVLYVVGEPSHHGAAIARLLAAVARVARRKGALPATGHAIRPWAASSRHPSTGASSGWVADISA